VSGWLEIASAALAFAAAGAFVGVASGALAVGGGAFAVAMTWQFLVSAGFAGEGALHAALGTALAALAALSALAWRAGRAQADPALGRWAGPALAGGALAGAALALAPERTAMAAAGLGALAAGLALALLDARARRVRPGLLEIFGVAAVSTVGGIGGGSLAAPLLRAGGMAAPAVAATAAGLGGLACGAAAAVLAAAGPAPGAPPFTLGAVNLPGAAAMTAAATAAAPIGARLAQAAPGRLIPLAAGFLLMVTGLTLIRAAFDG
jgi:uncharacterized membrane protein YfcA